MFEVGRLITSGEVSKIYEGTHVFSEKIRVVIKCIPKRKEDRFLEVVSLRSVDYLCYHPPGGWRNTVSSSVLQKLVVFCVSSRVNLVLCLQKWP